MKVYMKKLAPEAVLPKYGSPLSAGADLCALLPPGAITVAPGETVLVGTGLAMELEAGFVGLIYARSGLATKKGLAPANKVGVVDADYRGEIKVALHNHSAIPATVESGDRIAQLVIAPVLHAEFLETEELSSTERGEGGFGSTGTR